MRIYLHYEQEEGNEFTIPLTWDKTKSIDELKNVFYKEYLKRFQKQPTNIKLTTSAG